MLFIIYICVFLYTMYEFYEFLNSMQTVATQILIINVPVLTLVMCLFNCVIKKESERICSNFCNPLPVCVFKNNMNNC